MFIYSVDEWGASFARNIIAALQYKYKRNIVWFLSKISAQSYCFLCERMRTVRASERCLFVSGTVAATEQNNAVQVRLSNFTYITWYLGMYICM
jgi:hypothetical protein